MANATDIIRGSDGDYIIKNGMLVFGDSTSQHQEDILTATQGQYADSPTIGVGLVQYILDDDSQLGLETEIQKQFELDGMVVNTNKNGVIDANY